MTPRRRAICAMSGVLLIAYVSGYGLARWRKLLVRDSCTKKGSGGIYASGTDLRTSGMGAFKNAIAEPLASLYWPLCVTEGMSRSMISGATPFEIIKFQATAMQPDGWP